MNIPRLLASILLILTYHVASADEVPRPIEIHDRLSAQSTPGKQIALTLDACSGKYDDKLIEFLISKHIPATLFATQRWLKHNPNGVAVIRAHLDLFDVEDHGAKHIPAVIGVGRTVYGIPGEPDVAHLRQEVLNGALAVERATGIAPHWYRDATAIYDAAAIPVIEKLGYKIAGFSVNADQGATLDKRAIEQRLRQVRPGDVIIAHMNRPASDTAQGLAAGLSYLQEAGFVFVRLDQVELQRVP